MSEHYPCNCPCMDCIEGQHCGADSDAEFFGQPEVKFHCGYWWIPEEEAEREREEYDLMLRFAVESEEWE